VAASNTILIAGAGIGGLTTALALVGKGFQIILLEAARELSDAGAGIQLSPNATRILSALGLTEALRPHATTPDAIRVMKGRTGREIVRIPLSQMEARYGTPYWVVHRADLQRALLDAVAGQPDIVLRLGFNVLDVASHAHGVSVAGRTRSGVMVEEQGDALIGADGLWSTVRMRLGHEAAPRFRKRTAWRALLDASEADPAWLEAATHLWLGRDAHLVHYPVRNGTAVNVVAIIKDLKPAQGWASAGDRSQLQDRFARWSPPARAIIAAPTEWQTWSLHDLPASPRPGRGPVTLIGDAAHAMMPFLAQGAAMAIEDAAVLDDCVTRNPEDLTQAFRAFESERAERTMTATRESARMDTFYHFGGLRAGARDFIMRRAGGERLLARQDWLYRWPF
jgi:salicylate hydroxylase